MQILTLYSRGVKYSSGTSKVCVTKTPFHLIFSFTKWRPVAILNFHLSILRQNIEFMHQFHYPKLQFFEMTRSKNNGLWNVDPSETRKIPDDDVP